MSVLEVRCRDCDCIVSVTYDEAKAIHIEPQARKELKRAAREHRSETGHSTFDIEWRA